MKQTARWLRAALAAGAMAGGLAAQASAAAPPGRIQLACGGLARRAAEVSNVTLDGAMLRLGIRMLSRQARDAQARRVLMQLRGVYVKDFRFDQRGQYSARDLSAIRRQLRAPGWAHILSVHSRRAHRNVDIYVMSTAKGVAGMAIIAAYRRELRVLNLVGPIDPAALSRLGGHFGIPRVKAPPQGGAAGRKAGQPGRRQR